MRVAAYQAPLDASCSMTVLPLIQQQVKRCELLGVEILCCPEAVLGGLADYSHPPARFAIDAGRLGDVLAPLASDVVTTIVGFSEIDSRGTLYNAAAVFERGAVVGLYRKLHPAIHQSVYQPGAGMPTFTVGALTFGILICRDSTYSDPARAMAARGAAALFVPSNNGLPPAKADPAAVADAARRGDVTRATQNGVSIVRADVAGRTSTLLSHGSSAIVDRHGTLVASAQLLAPGLVIGEIDTTTSTSGIRTPQLT
jgi:predicted amidohydrolase